MNEPTLLYETCAECSACRRIASFLLLGVALLTNYARAEQPRVLVEGGRLELIAKQPQIVTPVGVALNHEGNLLVIESHTHKRSEGYQGPNADRVQILVDWNHDGTLDRWSTFADGFQAALNLLPVRPGRVLLVTRSSVELLIDSNGDLQADQQETILTLETEAEYPHNGLSGITLGKDGKLFIGIGENHGFPYRFVGSDGMSLSG